MCSSDLDGLVPLHHVPAAGLLGLGLGLPVIFGVIIFGGHLLQLRGQLVPLLLARLEGAPGLLLGLLQLLHLGLQPGGVFLRLFLGPLDIFHDVLAVKAADGTAKNMIIHRYVSHLILSLSLLYHKMSRLTRETWNKSRALDIFCLGYLYRGRYEDWYDTKTGLSQNGVIP